MNPFERLRETVQRNCHISDARHAQQDTLCIYLLKMRELFRWERGYAFGEPLPKEQIGPWIQSRESLWQELEEADFAPLNVGGECYPVFDSEAVNDALLPQGLVYSAGIGRHAKPSFFLADLERSEEVEGFTVHLSGREYARDLAAPPAMLRGEVIHVRRAALQRAIWEKVEESGAREGHAMRRAMAAYAFEVDVPSALAAMTDHELPYVVAHEVGEGRAGRLLGAGWERMVLNVAGSRNELIVRAVRDALADALVTLPLLVEREDLPAIHFYFANFTGLRRELNPRLADAYRRMLEGLRVGELATALEGEAAYWLAAGERLLAIDREGRWQGCGCLVEALRRQ